MSEQQNLEVKTRRQLIELAELLDVREDWHEPDEQELTVTFGGRSFDNAMCDETEKHIIIKHNGKAIARVNVAMLLAWATGFDEERWPYKNTEDDV